MATVAQSMKTWNLITKLLIEVVLGLLALSVMLGTVLPLGQIEVRGFLTIVIWLIGSLGVWFNMRFLTMGALVALIGLMLLQIVLGLLFQSSVFLIAFSLWQFTAFLALIRLSDFASRQLRILNPMKEPTIVGSSKQPSYDLIVRSVKRDLSRLGLAMGGAYFASILVLTGAQSLGGVFFAPYDVAVYILALVIALAILIIYAPSAVERQNF